ncbi:hypothetical protein Pcinc_021727 [Petrolisthes cinctipes]|uniref:Uncharacterized protein n=1 Tax=Petrolisthes cinctipes TaxID=88211 RepID=A0AAE1FFG2_PETCI|nr:hypothetical protein Pcinc_021727 [Petrolisthes cinctipes]
MDTNEIIKRAKRALDGYISYRKLVLLVLVLLVLLLYCGPSIFRLVLHTRPSTLGEDTASRSLGLRLDRFWQAAQELDVHILHSPPQLEERPFLPYVGNGLLGISCDQESPLYIRSGRTLSLPINYRPITLVSLDGMLLKEALVTEYMSGVVHRVQAWEQSNGIGGALDVLYQIYAHRTMPSLLLQDIKVINPTDRDVIVEVEQMGLGDWPEATTNTIKLHHGEGEHEYTTVTGFVEVPDAPTKVIPVAIITLKVPPSLQVKSRMSSTLHVVTSVNYTDPVPKKAYPAAKEKALQSALAVLKRAVTGSTKRLRQEHVQVWHELWSSGFSISHSRAESALNGDLINATIYHVLSQAPAPLHEVWTSEDQRASILRDIAYAEGCYGGHHTLQAERLWSHLSTVEDVNKVVGYWMLTLEKQGCHQLVRAGANGILQAMLLSFGGLRFRNQHLEFNTHPKDLHRDYFFRRVSYGNSTHLNISVAVQEEDYKAVIYTALDRSDRNYYACDAGCLDRPVELKQEKQTFPVKLTDPVTAILYITSDPRHMEELKHTIHVKEIALAPAHEHHIIAMHKHGHKWGGLPTLFWLTIIALILIFHLFLVKLVINEYCGGDVKTRYRKLSDF